jgi:hypothetical protein
VVLAAAFALLALLAAAGCTVVPPEGVGPYKTPDWSSLTPAAEQATPAPKMVEEVAVVSYPYTTFPNMPFYLKNFARSEGCAWMGIAGQVFDGHGNAVSGVVVNIGGVLNSNLISNMSTTGNVSTYGPGGYEIDIAPAPVDSTGSLWVMLSDPFGKQLSNKYYFNTYNDCEKNLILYNFTTATENKYHLPLIFK